MKLEFDFSDENKIKYKDYLNKLDQKATSLGLNKTKFGTYEGIVSETNFDDFIFFTLITNIIYENAKYCFIYEDKNNLQKEDALKTFNTVKERNSYYETEKI